MFGARTTAVAAAAVALYMSAPALAQQPAATVDMTDQLNYQPPQIQVSVGDTVVWRNTSSVVHTVTADPSLARDPSHVQLPPGVQPFNSGNIQPGSTFSYTFQVPGDYRYFCIPHEAAGMIGSVRVLAR